MDITDNTAYIENGYTDREHYLRTLAKEYDISYNRVLRISDILGKEEDFYQLIIALDDMDGNND